MSGVTVSKDGVVTDERPVEEHLTEAGPPGQLAQWADLDAGGLHRDDERGEAAVLGALGIRAGKSQADVRDLRV